MGLRVFCASAERARDGKGAPAAARLGMKYAHRLLARAKNRLRQHPQSRGIVERNAAAKISSAAAAEKRGESSGGNKCKPRNTS